MKNMLFLLSSFVGFTCLHSYQPLDEDDVQLIYQQFVKVNYTKEYKTRYVPLPMSRNNTPWNWKGKDFPRVISLLEFEKFVKDNDLECSKGLSINGMDPEWYSLPAESVTKVDYTDDKINHDLHRLNLPEKDYDFVIVNQTLEHVYDPVRCLEKIYDHMRPGGILYFNVPANSIPHSTPYHYYTGFTPVGIGAIAMIAGFEILSIGQWGNLEYLNKMQESRKWPDYTVLENPGYNDVHSPVITWIFCRKK